MNNFGKSPSLKQYFREIESSKPYSQEEEYALAKKIKKGDLNAKSRLVEANLRFVVSIAGEYQGRGLPNEDLIAEGNKGLIEAVDRFDENRGYKFISYAVWWIRQSIQIALKLQNPVRVPLNRLDLMDKISKITRNRENGHETTKLDIDYLEVTLGKSRKHITETLQMAQKPRSLESKISEDDNRMVLERMADPYQIPPDAVLEKKSLKKEIDAVLSTLDEREQEVLKMSFGLDGKEEQTLVEIGTRFNITRERARQIKEKALSKLRRPAKAGKLKPYFQE